MASGLEVIDLTVGSPRDRGPRKNEQLNSRTDVIDLVGGSPAARKPLAPVRQQAVSQRTRTADSAGPAAAAAAAAGTQPSGDAVDLTDSQGDFPPSGQRPPAPKRRRTEPAGNDWLDGQAARQEVQLVRQHNREPQQRQQEHRQQAQEQGTHQEPQQCFICFEDEAAAMKEGGMMHTLGGCYHCFCLPCLRSYISGKVADRSFPVACPLPDCKQPISAAECGLVLTPEEQATLGKMEAEAAIGEGARLFCPNPTCSQLLLADDKRENTAMECPYCSQELCANCGVAWHAGMTCQQYQAQPGALRSKEDQAVLDMAAKEGLRRCPACGQMVERTQGCSHMHCRCGARFCYSCGKSKQPGSNHYCDCKPAAEQWLHPPPAVAQQLRGPGQVADQAQQMQEWAQFLAQDVEQRRAALAQRQRQQQQRRQHLRQQEQRQQQHVARPWLPPRMGGAAAGAAADGAWPFAAPP